MGADHAVGPALHGTAGELACCGSAQKRSPLCVAKEGRIMASGEQFQQAAESLFSEQRNGGAVLALPA
jgi:hypothetical protein